MLRPSIAIVHKTSRSFNTEVTNKRKMFSMFFV